MHIIDNKNKVNFSGKISKFTIVFSGQEACQIIARELRLLANDDWLHFWHAFEGKKAKQLLSLAIDGLIVFLSCECEKNRITGEFFSLDRKSDAELLKAYVREAQNDACIDIEEVMAA